MKYATSLFKLCFAIVISFALTHAHAAERIALVIGNAAYAEAPLYNPLNDAKAMGARLRQVGFEVVEVTDADLDTMQQAVMNFMNQVTSESTALVFYAGHGIQANGRNYLIPIDASLKSERALRFEALELNDILEELEEIEAKINIVILDACRNNPFARRFRGGSRGLAVVDAAQGTLIAYATAPGSVASDGHGDNGLYTQELLKALAQPNLQIEEVFKNVRREVAEQSGGEQIPWESSSLVGDFVFNQTINPIDGQTDSISTQIMPTAHPEDRTLKADQLLWQAIADSSDPEAFEDYLVRYPDGVYAGIAKRQLTSLAKDNSCEDLSGQWRAWLQDSPQQACRDSFTLRRIGESLYDIDYAMCGAMDAVTNIRGKGTFEDNVLSFKWRSTPCSGTTEYTLNKQCETGTGRVVKRGGLPGVCSLFVNKNVVVDVERVEH
jgi:hypothetical protein